MMFTKKRVLFLKPYVRDFDCFIEELRKLLEPWREWNRWDSLDKPASKTEVESLMAALGGLSEGTQCALIFTKGERDRLLDRLELLKDRLTKKGRPVRVESNVLIERLCILLKSHAKSIKAVLTNKQIEGLKTEPKKQLHEIPIPRDFIELDLLPFVECFLNETRTTAIRQPDLFRFLGECLLYVGLLDNEFYTAGSDNTRDAVSKRYARAEKRAEELSGKRFF